MLSFVMNNYMGLFLLGEGEEGGWVKLLIFVVIGGVMLINNIIKSRSDKLEEQKRQERKKNAPARSPEREAAYRKQLAARQARLQQQIHQREAARGSTGAAAKPIASKPTYQRPVSGAQRPAAIRVPPVQQLKKLVFAGEIPTLEPDDLAVEPVRQERKVRVPKARTPIPKEAEEEVELVEIFTGGGDWDEFQRAILYLEILGKPASLRAPIS
ncbi:MAG: hypothetical protein ACYSWP_03145 [Planctomycetota bacterium]|jgi:hypothetical protein